jgi:hypothetical protein
LTPTEGRDERLRSVWAAQHYENLPEDPEQAFLLLEDKFRAELDAITRAANAEQDLTVERVDYIAQVIGGGQEGFGRGAVPVRCYPESRHCSAPLACPLSPISGCERLQQANSLFDHLVGAGEQLWGNSEPEHLSGLEVDE